MLVMSAVHTRCCGDSYVEIHAGIRGLTQSYSQIGALL